MRGGGRQEGLISGFCLAESICACSVQTQRGASEPAAGRKHTKRSHSRSICAEANVMGLPIYWVKELTSHVKCLLRTRRSALRRSRSRLDNWHILPLARWFNMRSDLALIFVQYEIAYLWDHHSYRKAA